jgi:8-oxo-dGTP pyrophosphatase MutT (NUDIX family)
MAEHGDRRGELRPGPAEKVNLGEPSVPRPAASVILLRKGGEHSDKSLEVLLLKRSEGSSFMPGVWVFPGGAVDAEDGTDDEGFRSCAARELAEEAAVVLDAGELVLFTRWITPEVVATRFDAWFFLAPCPPHTNPQPDGHETTEARWFEPQAALDANAAGEIPLVFPTIKQLERLVAYATPDEALAAARELTVEPILPRVIADGTEGHRVILPGEPGYE